MKYSGLKRLPSSGASLLCVHNPMSFFGKPFKIAKLRAKVFTRVLDPGEGVGLYSVALFILMYNDIYGYMRREILCET